MIHNLVNILVRLLLSIKTWLFSIREDWVLKGTSFSEPGTQEWLIHTEVKYGGFVSGVKRSKVSVNDPRDQIGLDRGGMEGGDRMLHHGYASMYSEFLRPFIDRAAPVTLAEVGILKGTGLAMWCDLFPYGRVIGLDIDVSHFEENLTALKKHGAFQKNQPEVYEFDQLKDNRNLLSSILNEDQLDLCMDDGLHTNEAILMALDSFFPFLAEKFVYFIEDNKEIHKKLLPLYPDCSIVHDGELTVMHRGWQE